MDKDNDNNNDTTAAESSKAEKPPKRPGVRHTYRDFANVSVADAGMLFHSAYGVTMRQHNPLAQGTQQQGFAVKLHYMLEDIESSGESNIVSWQPHGRSFLVHNRNRFVERVLPNYFLQTTFASFQRQLNLYGFTRISSGQDKGGYYHELFLRTKPELACFIQRIKRKGTGPRRPDSPESEPDFYSMPYLPPTSETPARCGVTPQQALLSGQMPQQPFQQPWYVQDPQHHQKTSGNSLSLRNLLPASLGSTQVHLQQQQQQEQQQQQQQHQNAQAQAAAAAYNEFMQQPQPLLPSSGLTSSFSQQLESTLNLSSDSLSKQLEPTPINPAYESTIRQGASQAYPFAPLAPPPSYNGNITQSNIGNNASQGNGSNPNNSLQSGNNIPTNTVPMNPPPPLWTGSMKMPSLPQSNGNVTGNSSNNALSASNASNNFSIPNPWQNVFLGEEDMIWPFSNQMGGV